MGNSIFKGEIMSSPICLKGAIPRSLIRQIRTKAEEVLRQVYDDYFSQKTFEDFQRDHIEHAIPSVVSKVITLRFFNLELLVTLREFFKKRVEKAYGEVSPLLIHPGFYLRFSWPNAKESRTSTETFLDSAPHYDITFGLPAYTFWVPLVEINDDTGGLCSFKGENVFKLLPPPRGNSNKYNYKSYIKAAPKIDKCLSRGVKNHNLKLGDVLTWDSTLLHGATRPRRNVRISIDLRLVSPSKLRGFPKKIKKIFQEVNESFELTRAQNLMVIGDFIGAAPILELISQKTKNKALSKIAEVLRVCPPRSEIFKKNSKFHWTDEYRWIMETMDGAR